MWFKNMLQCKNLLHQSIHFYKLFFNGNARAIILLLWGFLDIKILCFITRRKKNEKHLSGHLIYNNTRANTIEKGRYQS